MKRITKILLWIVGIWAGLTIAAEVALTSPFVTKTINKYAAEYIDGNLSFGRASVSLFRDYPSVNLKLEDFSITYPSDRFDSSEKIGAQGHLMRAGSGETADTLASFSRFSVSVSPVQLLLGKISIHSVELVKPRIFAHTYGDGKTNLNMFILGADSTQSEETEESGSLTLPKISIRKVHLTENPRIVYTDSKDTIFALINMRRALFDGHLTSEGLGKSEIDFKLDSMIVAGRLAADTLSFTLDGLDIKGNSERTEFHAEAKTRLATSAFGRARIPIVVDGEMSFPEDSVMAVQVDRIAMKVASIPIHGSASVRLVELGPDNLPDMKAALEIPQSTVRIPGFDYDIAFALKANAATDSRGRMNVTLGKAAVSTYGLELDAAGSVKDLLGGDPSVSVSGKLSASLDSLSTFIPDTMQMEAHGWLRADVDGNMNLSQMDIYNFSKSEMTGKIVGDSICLRSAKDSLDVDIMGLSVVLGPEEHISRRDSTKTRRLMAVTGTVANADMAYGSSMHLKAEGLTVAAQNSMSSDTSRINPLAGQLSAKKFSFTDAAGMSVKLDNSANSFSLRPKRGSKKIPQLSFRSKNKKITLIAERNRAILTDANLSATAAMNTVETRARRKAYMDSLSRVYPGVPRDSLLIHARSKRQVRELPEWMQDEDFRKQDIDIRLDETMAKYFREWDLNGDVDIRTGIVMTPYFPLRNILRGFEAHFNNDEVGIDSLKFMSGESELALEGKLSGLKRALGGRGRARGVLKLDAEFTSQGMNANELLRAYAAGSKFNPESLKGSSEEMTDAEFLKAVVVSDTAATEELGATLFVIPANVMADIRIDAHHIKYSDLDITDLVSKVTMKERCVQMTNTSAVSNMGNISFDAFYSTKSKEDLKTGFSLNFEDITAEKVLDLMPAADTLMPLLKSFKGLLNCELAATASLDTNMNILTPTINGVMRISGDDLSMSDNELFRTLAKKLFFKNKKEGIIDEMMIEGLIKDNTLEIFPFVLKIDRYTLALSGVQNLDMSFKYHVSVLRSPFLIKLGIDLSGDSFDDMRFRIGRPKYKTTRIPLFSPVIDRTKLNLVTSIRNIFAKGVEAAVKENEMQEVIEEHKKETGYVQAIDQELEPLSEDEQKQMEADEAASEAEEAAAEGAAAEGAATEGQDGPENNEETIENNTDNE